MKKMITIVAVALTSVMAFGATMSHSYDTGTFDLGATPLATINVAKFDNTLGTLTKVTFEITLETWGGSFTITGNGSTTKSGTATFAGRTYLTGSIGSATIWTSAATTSDAHNFSIVGTESKTVLGNATHTTSPKQTQVISGGALAGAQGSGTYAVVFHNENDSTVMKKPVMTKQGK